MAGEFLMVMLWNVDKLMLWWLVGTRALGVYAVQAYITNGVLLLSRAIYQVLHPHMAEHVGREGGVKTIQPYLERGTLLLVQLACPVIGLLYLVLHLPIRWWLPEYTDAIEPGRILILMAFFSVTAVVPSTVLVSLGAQRRLVAIRAFAVTLSLAALSHVLRSGGDFVDVALAASVGLVTYPVLTVGTALRHARLKIARVVRFLAWLVLPLTMLVVSLWGMTQVIPDAASSWQEDVLFTLARCAVIAAIFIPWAVWSNRRLRA